MAVGDVEPFEEPGPLGEIGPRDGRPPDGLLLGEPLVDGPLPDGLPALALVLDEAELCGVLGLLTGLLTGLVGVPEGVPLGLVGGVDGVVGPLDGELLGGPLGLPPEPPTPLRVRSP